MFLPRLPSELNPVFRLLDADDACCSTRPMNLSKPRPTPSFSPKFDIRESKDGYHLDGELPGVNQDNIEIDFTDSHTLVIKGHSQRNTNNATEPQEPDDTSNSDTASTKSHQPTVEDEDASSSKAAAPAPKPSDEVGSKQESEPSDKYLVSERSTGEFRRTFTFPARIDQDGVTARLRNGILSVVVPREPARAKKIRVE
jgi:HSP20 family molecular chaperone IbpA